MDATTLYERIMAAKPCYLSEHVRELADAAERDGLLATLLTIPPPDARWVLSRLMTGPQRAMWSRASAERAHEYARDAADYANASRYAGAAAHVSRYAYYAADAAADASRYAGYAAADAAFYADVPRYDAAGNVPLNADAAYYAADAAADAARAAEHRRACEHALTLLETQ